LNLAIKRAVELLMGDPKLRKYTAARAALRKPGYDPSTEDVRTVVRWYHRLGYDRDMRRYRMLHAIRKALEVGNINDARALAVSLPPPE
jgi:hypothetical protein